MKMKIYSGFFKDLRKCWMKQDEYLKKTTVSLLHLSKRLLTFEEKVTRKHAHIF